MGSSKSPPDREKSTQDSIKFNCPNFSDLRGSPHSRSRQPSQDSHYWMNEFLAQEAASPIFNREEGSSTRGTPDQHRPLTFRSLKRGDIHPVEHRIDLSSQSKQPLVPDSSSIFSVTKPVAAGENDNEKSKEQTGQQDVHRDLLQPESEPSEAQARRFSAKYFESFVWPLMKPKIVELSEKEIHTQIKALLDEEVTSLRSLTRTPRLKANSTPEEYELYVRFLRERLAQTPSVVAKSEAVMSMVMNLLPGLKASLSGLITETTVEETESEDHIEQEPDDEREADEEQNEPVEQEEPLEQELADQGECIQQEEPSEPQETKELETDVEQGQPGWQYSHAGREEDDEQEESEDSEATTILDDDGSLYQDDPFDIDEEDSVVPSVEPHTPIVTPRLMTQLRTYEKKYSKTLKSSQLQKRGRTHSSLHDHSATNTPSRHTGRLPETPDNLVIQRQEGKLETASEKQGELNRAAAKRRASEMTPTPVRSASKRLRLDWQSTERVLDGQSAELIMKGQSLEPILDGQASEPVLDKKSPEPMQSPASSCSDFPSLEELFSSSLGKLSSPVRQSSTAPNMASTPPSSKGKESEVNRSNTKPPVPRFSKEPGLFVTPSPIPASANKPFTFKRSASRSVRHTTPSQRQRDSMPPSRFRETTADFEALDHSEKLMLLFKMSRGNMRG
ncbi:uncharacterized protein FIESC28_04554 [Fusarium coffeatum]|uniref:Uncharacterized protein n=1 Tax=Fusarium coffeatum TaxID=231269 RepID=A0A366S0Y9_9HYPO|nr:uncharacterized protein FIESC28_04554 [Fusarium coffeatum]RBR22360.1 hypothetical protein FIESC28_04554 [Fusarium coffeatum]